MEKLPLLGDEAVGLASIHSGISGAYGYPGTPSTEIFEYVEARSQAKGIHALWSTNEKVAYEEALGMSWAGKRALAVMKHVGLNVAADAFMNSAVTGVNGGLVLAVADDPGMHSSQNEQDSRFLAQFALIPCLEPRDQQQAYDMTREAFDISEHFRLPVMVRMVTRLAHSRSAILPREPRDQNPLSPLADWTKWTLLPTNARNQYQDLVTNLPKVRTHSEASAFNVLELRGQALGVISAGIAANYLWENLADDHDFSLLHIGFYPTPLDKIRALAAHVKEILVVEDGYPFVENQLSGYLPQPLPVRGRLTGDLPRTGELNPSLVRRALGLADLPQACQPLPGLAGRPPALCKGCGHGDAFRALKEALAIHSAARAFSDIGCYTLGAYPPYEAIGSCVCMGASISMASGAAHAGYRPAVAVIGDSTFAHGGMTSLLSAISARSPITVVIVDNSTVAMTGGQSTILSGQSLDNLILGLGIPQEHLKIIVPLPKNHEENVRILSQEIAHPGTSVVIARRPCIQNKK